MPPLLRVSGLTFSYDPEAEPLLRGVTFECNTGKIYGLFGNNGSGKTTLFNIICGLTRHTAGQIDYYGGVPSSLSPSNICSFRHGLARTFQVPALVDEISVFDNLTLARRSVGERFCDVLHSASRLDEKFESQIEEYLRAVAIDPLANKAAGSLSYGERRLVSDLMALLTGAQIVLMDEPFSNVDAGRLDALKRLLRKEAREAGKCIVIIEHSPEHLAQDLIDSVFCLRKTLVVNGFEGSPQETLRVINSFTYDEA